MVVVVLVLVTARFVVRITVAAHATGLFSVF
jgi:hypothetical protein